MRGADLSRLDDVHQFYILAIPAIAGFGWTAPRMPSRSVGFAVISFLMMVLVAFYTLPFPFVERASVRCSYAYEKPRHYAFGFQYEPWTWERPYNFYAWALAPGALAELTLRYINQPLTGMLCDGRGDLPPELLPKPLYPPK